MAALGRHILVELSGCDPEILNDVSAIETAMVESARKAGATVINSTFHHFSPFGVSGVVVIQESHLAIHSWPEYGYAAVDLFTCGDTVEPWISFDHLKESLKAKNHSAIEMYRGSLHLLNRTPFEPKTPRMDPYRSEVELVDRGPEEPRFVRTLWFTDRDANQALSLRYTGDCLSNQKSPFQTVRVFQTPKYGKMLTIDSAIMVTERDEQHYHEMLVHPALQTLKTPRRVLVIGGGDGGTVREVLKYSSLEKVVMVEIDEEVVKASRAHFPFLSRDLTNPKVELRFEDGIEFVKKALPEEYDAIFIDGSDPVGPAEGLFTESFYRNCHRALKSTGVLAAQGESPMFHEKAFVGLNHCLKRVFGPINSHVALFFHPTYPTGMWSIHVSVKGDLNPLTSVGPSEIENFVKQHRLHYYNAGIHFGSFSLPGFVQKMLELPN